jgi:low temperature requirement protein LtrA
VAGEGFFLPARILPRDEQRQLERVFEAELRELFGRGDSSHQVPALERLLEDPEHFAERFGLIVLIALCESIIAIAVGAGFELTTGVIAPALLGIVVVSALWWLYFDVAAILARSRLVEAQGLAQAQLARDAYNYLHLPLVAGIVPFALGFKTTIEDVAATLGTVPAVALCGGAALYLVGHITFLFRATGRVFRRRTVGAVVLLALIPASLMVPALAALGLVSAVCSLVVAYEAIHRRDARMRLRHPEIAA